MGDVERHVSNLFGKVKVWKHFYDGENMVWQKLHTSIEQAFATRSVSLLSQDGWRYVLYPLCTLHDGLYVVCMCVVYVVCMCYYVVLCVFMCICVYVRVCGVFVRVCGVYVRVCGVYVRVCVYCVYTTCSLHNALLTCADQKMAVLR